MLSLLLLLLFSFVSSGPIKFSTGGQFTLQKTSKPHEFTDSIYIFSYQDCLEKVNVLGNFILKNITYSTAPYGCFLAANEHPPTVYWNPDNTNQACSDTYACVVNNADYVDTFFYGQKTVKNVSDTRAGLGKTSFTKNVIETIPMQLQTITELITQKQCSDDDHCNNGHNDCQPGDNCVAHEYKCQTDWNYDPFIMSKLPPELSYLNAFIGPPQSGDLQHYHNGNDNDNCAGEDNCKTTCSESITCMGYSKYTYRDDTEPWPDSTNTFDMVGDVGGNCCMGDGCSTNEDDCITKCANDDDCEGYTKYWWPVVVDGTDFTEQNTEEIPTDLCTSALRNNIATNTDYQNPNIVGFSIATRDYSPLFTSSLTSTTNTQGCQIVEGWCAGSSVSGELAEYYVKTYGTTCHGECASINSVGRNRWNIFYSSSGSIASSSRNFGGSQHVGYYTNGEPHTTISCTYSLQHTPLRRIVQWRWGKITTNHNHFSEESYLKSNNAEQWKYGLKNNADPNYVNVQLMQSSTKMLRDTTGNYENTNTLNKEDCESVRNTNQITLWKHYIGSYPHNFKSIPIAAGVVDNIGVSLNSMVEIDTDKLPYGCLLTTGGTVHWNKGNNPYSPESVNTIFNQCGAFQVEYYGTQYEDDFNTLHTNDDLFPFANYFMQYVNGIEYYNAICIQYPTVPCTFNTPGGGVFYQKNLSQFPTTNEDIAYVRNENRVSLLQPIKTNTEDALRFCLDLCDRTADCFYANIGADNACEMYRKCESSSTSTRELYRKLPFFLNLSSTSSDVSSSYYYDIGVLDNSCNMIEDRLDCYLDYCNRHTDIRDDLCDDTCDTDEELALCKTHWEEKGINDPSRNFDEATECITNIEIAQTSRDNNCPEFCVNTPGCFIAYKSDTACHALPYCTMEAGNTKGHIITKIVRDQSYHPMFPYNAFWSCDGIVMENVDIDTCIEKTKSENRFIFSYNNDTNTCLVYEHYKENAYDELMDHGINATWCYSNGILQDAITSLGSCSAPTWDERNQVETLESKYFTTLVDRKSGTGAQQKCMTPFSTLLSGHNIVLSSNLLTYLNLVDALSACFETSDCHHIVQFEAQNQIVLASSVTPTFIEVDNGASITFAVLEVTSGSPALEGSFDWMSEADCKEYAQRNGDMWGVASNIGSRPLGCYKRSDDLNYYYQTTVNNNIDCDSSWICIKKRWWTTITSGSPAIEGDAAYVNQDECRYKYNNAMYAGSGNMGSGVVSGCYYDGYNIFFQRATTDAKCGDTQQCIKKSADPLRYVSQAECEAYADPSTWYPSDYGSSVPSGCFLHSNGQVQFNQGNGANQCNDAGHKCIQKAGVEVGTFTTVDKTCDLPPNACIDLETRSMTLETSGYPDTSITKVFDDNTRTSMDCQSAAEELGYTVSSIEIVTKPNSATGCILDSDTAKWNIGPYETLALTYPFEECLSNSDCEVGKPEDENEFTEIMAYKEVSSGLPDLSISETECKALSTYGGAFNPDSGTFPFGCIKGTTFIYRSNGIVDDAWVLTRAECYAWAQAQGISNVGDNTANSGPGCVTNAARTYMRYNPNRNDARPCGTGGDICIGRGSSYNYHWNPNAGDAGTVCGSSNYNCVQKKAISLEECMIKVHKLGKEAGHHALGEHLDGSGAYTGGTCWYKNSGSITSTLAAHNVKQEVGGLGFIEVNDEGFILVDHGAPDLSVTLEECQAMDNYFSVRQWTANPKGCISSNGNINWNAESFGTDSCGSGDMNCIQKVQGWITEADCGAANSLVGVSASDYTTISDFHKPHGCIEGAWNNRPSSPTPTINLEYVQFSATSALDICQGNCGGDDNKCKDNLKCESGTTVAGCTGTVDASIDYCYYDGSCSSTTPCLRQRCKSTSSSDRRRRLLQFGGGLGGGLGVIVSNTFASNKAYDEGDPCGFVEYWHARQVASFDVVTKPQTIGGWVPSVYQKTDGDNYYSLTAEECEAYADESNTLAFYTHSSDTRPKGCWIETSNVYWNSHPTSTNECGATPNFDCLQKHTTAITDEDYCKHLDNFVSVITDPLKATGCIIENDLFYYNTYAFNGVSTIVPNGKIIQVDNGAPDLSVTKAECQDYGIETDGINYGGSMTNYGWPKGCIYVSSAEIKFNDDTSSSVECGETSSNIYTPNCIQKVDILSYAISPAPCSATTPCFKHHEKHFNSTYEIDTATGETHCYEGSGVLTNMIEVTSGAPVSGDPYVGVPSGIPEAEYTYKEVTNGTPDLSVSEAECHLYALHSGLGYYIPYTWSSEPSGCWRRVIASGTGATHNKIYFNTANTNYQCGPHPSDATTTFSCVQRDAINPVYVTEPECPYAYNPVYWPSDPPGCIIASSTTYYWNTAESTASCSSTYKCIKKNTNYDPNAYVSDAECEAYAESKGNTMQVHYGASQPVGCGYYNPSQPFYWSPNGGDCGINGISCIQKSNMAHKKSRVLANNQVGELTDYTGLVRSDDCPEPYVWDENEYIEVPSGAPATLGVEVSSGSAAEIGTDEYMTVEECEAYAEANSLTWSGIQSESAREGIPNGCVVQRETINHVKFNPLTTSVRNCGDYWEGGSSGFPWVCIQKSSTFAAYVSKSECEQYAVNNGLTWGGVMDTGVADPQGCYFNGNAIYYNTRADSTKECINPYTCIQQKIYDEDNYKTYMLGSIQYDVGADTCGSCFPGHYTSEDSVCLPCQIGRYVSRERISTQGYMPSCLFCEPGRFQNEEGQASCKACERRTYQDERGQTSCKPVDDGQFAVGTGTWTGTSGPDQSNTRSDEATAFEGALTQANGCDTNDGYFFVCVNEDGTEFTPILTEGQNIETACVGGNFRCSACGPGNKIVDNACVPCPQGTYQNALRARGSSCKSCVVGQYQFDIGEKSCKETDPGYFQNSIMQFLQLPCPSGSFTSVSGSENCISCPVGRSSTEGQTLTDSGEVRDTISVLNCYGCSAGLFQDEIGKIKCNNCDQGQFSGEDATICVDCDAGKFREFSTDGDCRFTDKGYFQHQEGQAGQLPCSEGSIAPVEGETNPSCQACPAGKYQDEPGRSECKLCAAGRYNSASGFHIDCEACNPGTSSEDVISRVICNPCAAGKYADGSTNNLCVPCLQGEWSGGGASVCNKCPSGYEATAVDEDGHVSQDLACNRCAKGTYQSQEGNYQCKICPRGRYLPTEGGTAIEDCIGCPAGTFLSDGSATAGTDKTLHDNIEDCKSCQDTAYTGAIPGGFSVEGAHECILCAAGSFTSKSKPSLAYEDQCDECDAGSYNPSENSQCIPCGTGQYQNQNGATSCKACSQGTEPTADRTDCQDCTAGKYQGSNSGGTCKDCPVGKYTPVQGMSVCDSCGEWQCANAGATSCTESHSNAGGAPTSSAICRCDRTGACTTCGTSNCRKSTTLVEQAVSTAEVSINCGIAYSSNYGMMALCIAEAWTKTVTTVTRQKEVQWKIMCGGACGGNCNSNTGTCS